MKKQLVPYAPRRREFWGDTKSKDGIGRRIVVRPIKPNVTIDDLKKYFSPRGCLEGVAIVNQQAFIQFRRPSEASSAIRNYNRTFLSEEMILVSNYEERERDKPRAKRPDFREEPLDDILAKESVYSYSYRSRSRSRSRSPIEYNQARSSRRHIDDLGESNNQVAISKLNSESINLTSQNINNTDISQVFANYGSDRSKVQENTQSNTSSVSTFTTSTRLPHDIEFLLKYISEIKSARVLSLVQLSRLISFFEYEKMAVASKERANHSQQAPPNPEPSEQQAQQENNEVQSEQVVFSQEQELTAVQEKSDIQMKREQQNDKVMDVTPESEKLNDLTKLIRQAMQ